jgi:phosphoglycolate phosphatase
MKFDMVVFDFDGTLVDSFASGVAIMQRIGPALNLKPIDDLESARGLPTKEFLKKLGVRFWSLPRVVRAYQAEAAKEAPHLKLFAQWQEVLPRFKAAGLPLGILSSNSEPAIRACLEANGAGDWFDFVVGYPKLFGKAKMLRRILRERKVDRPRLLYVGDEVRDVEAAKKAKVGSAACAWGFHAEALLRSAQPDVVLTAPGELARYVWA